MAAKKPQLQVQAKINKKELEPFYKRNLLPLIVFCFAFLLYANTIPNGYNLDDELVTRHHKLTSQGLSAIPEILASPYYQDNMGYAYDYRPVVLVSFAIEHQFFGDNPNVGHFINVLLFAFTCLLLYYLLLAMLGTGRWFTLGVVLLFAAHPVHTEVVCSLKNRDELLSLFFAMAGFSYFLKYYDRGRLVHFLAGVGLIVLAYLSKLSVLSFSIIIPVALMLFRGRKNFKLLAIYFTTLIPGLLVNPLATPQMDVELFLASALVIIGVASLLEFESVKSGLSKAIDYVRSIPSPSKSLAGAPLTETGLQGDSPMQRAGFVLAKNWWLTGFLALVVITGIGLQLPYLILAAQLVLAVIYFTGNRYQKWYAYIFLTVSLLFDFITLHYVSPLCLQLLGFWILAHTIKRQPGYYIPSILLSVICYWFMMVVGDKDSMYPYLAFLLLLINRRWLRIGVVAWVVLRIVVTSTYPLSAFEIVIHNAVFVLVTVYVLMRRVPKFQRLLTASLALTVIGCFAILLIQFNTLQPLQRGTLIAWKHHSPAYNFEGRLPRIHEALNTPTALVKVNANRPLSIVESPVRYHSAFSKKVGTSMLILLKYLKLLIVPYPLLFYYGYRLIEPTDFLTPLALAGFALYLCIGIFALYSLRKNKISGFGLFAFLAGIAPFSNLLFLLPGGLGERYLLIPSLGFCIVIMVAIFAVFKIDKNTGDLKLTGNAGYFFSAILLVYSGITFSRNFDWKDDLTLFTHDIKNGGESFMQNNLLGIHLAKQAEALSNPAESNDLRRQAVVYFRKAYSIYPQLMNTPYDIGRVYSLMGQTDSALPWFLIAHQLDSSFKEIDWDIGMTYMTGRKNAEAIPYLEEVLQSGQHQPDIYPWLSMAYFNIGKFEQSIAVNRKSITGTGNNLNTFTNIGRTYQEMHQIDSAVYYYRLAAALNPNDEHLKRVIQSMEQMRH